MSTVKERKTYICNAVYNAAEEVRDLGPLSKEERLEICLAACAELMAVFDVSPCVGASFETRARWGESKFAHFEDVFQMAEGVKRKRKED